MKKQETRKKRNRRAALTVLFLYMAIAGGFLIVTEYLVYLAGQKSYDSLASFVNTASETEAEETVAQAPVKSGTDWEIPDAPGSPALPDLSGIASVTGEGVSRSKITNIDFDALLAINPEITGWIEVPGTKVSYPVVFRPEDSDYYLTHTVDGTEAKAGAIHLDGASNGMDSQNILIYGHNLLDYTMFSSLHSYKSQNFYESNPYIYLYLTDGSCRRYRITAVVVTWGTDESLYMSGFADTESAQEYYDRIMSQAMYDTGVTIDAAEGKQTILLSTCYRTYWKRLVLAVLE